MHLLLTLVSENTSFPASSPAVTPPSVYRELQATGLFDQMSQSVDEEEHSIEMHLPYVAKVMESRRGQFTIVPVLVGALKEEREVEYGKIFSKYLADPSNLFVISSDFCHWGECAIVVCCVSTYLCRICCTFYWTPRQEVFVHPL